MKRMPQQTRQDCKSDVTTYYGFIACIDFYDIMTYKSIYLLIY